MKTTKNAALGVRDREAAQVSVTITQQKLYHWQNRLSTEVSHG